MSNLLDVPDIPPGANPFSVYLSAVGELLFPEPSKGFEARLYVLWALQAYVVVIAILNIVGMLIDYRRRGKTLWVWRLVHRSNGRYIVANQHVIFCACSFIAAAVMIGYTLNCYRTLILREKLIRAYWWRTFVWVPLLFHGWLSSFANLQAAVLSSQKASANHVLSPRMANTLYIGGLVVMMAPVVALDSLSAIRWRNFWQQAEILRDILLGGQETFETTGNTDIVALARASAQLNVAVDRLDAFSQVRVASSSIYVVSTALIVAINVGGLSLLLTLRRQISFNTRRFSTDVRSSHGLTSGDGAGIGADSAISPSGVPRPSIAASLDGGPGLHSMSEQDRRASAASAGSNGLRKVFFQPNREGGIAEGQENEKQPVKVSHKHLKNAAGDKNGSAGADLRTQARQILALQKISWDLLTFIVAVVTLATMFMGIAMWIAIVGTGILDQWASVECALFLIPWAYLFGISAALTFLLYNTLRHLTKPAANVSTLGVAPNGMTGEKAAAGVAGHGRHAHRRASESGLSSYNEESRTGRTSGNGHGGASSNGHVSVGMNVPPTSNWSGVPRAVREEDEDEEDEIGRGLGTQASRGTASQSSRASSQQAHQHVPIQFQQSWEPVSKKGKK